MCKCVLLYSFTTVSVCESVCYFTVLLQCDRVCVSVCYFPLQFYYNVIVIECVLL